MKRISISMAGVLIGAMLMPAIAGASILPTGSTAPSLPAGVVAVPSITVFATAIANLGNGNSDVTFSNGQTVTLPTNEASQISVHSNASPSPDNTVYGNCGDSYLYLEKNGDAGVWGYTGYDVTPSVIGTVLSFYWEIHTENTSRNIGVTNLWDGLTSAYSWIQDYYVTEGLGNYESHVITGYVIGTKTTCYSGDPNSSNTIP